MKVFESTFFHLIEYFLAGPPPPGGAGPPKAAASKGGAGRGALLSQIQGGFNLKKTAGPPEPEGPGTVVGAPRVEKPAAARPEPPRGFGGGGGDMMAELKRRAEQRQGKTNPGSTVPRNTAPAAPPKVAPKFEPKTTPPSHYVPANRSNPTGNKQTVSDGDNNEIKRIIQEELAKMKNDFIREFREMIREELRSNNH